MKIVLKDVEAFNALLIRKGFTKNKFAKLISISGPMLVQISNGDRNPGPETAKRIVEALQVEWDHIFALERGRKAAAGY